MCVCICICVSLYIYEYICISHIVYIYMCVCVYIYIPDIYIFQHKIEQFSFFQLNRIAIHPAASFCQVGYYILQGTERKIEQSFYFEKVYIWVHLIFPSKGKHLNFISEQFLGACALSRNSEQQQEEDSRFSIHQGQISYCSQLNKAWVTFRNCTAEYAQPKFKILEEMPTCQLQLQPKYCDGYCMI